MSQELIQQVLTALSVLTLVFFRQNQSGREEIAHAAFDILGKLKEQVLTRERALELLLATSLVKEATAKRFVNAVIRHRPGKCLAYFEEEIVPGVLVSVGPDGEVQVSPKGLLNTLAHRLNKWTKSTLGLRLF